MRTALNIYVFRDRHFAPAGDTVVCIGGRGSIEALLGNKPIPGLFTGQAVYTNDETNQDYVGVWGKREASRFRRLLRERGADLLVHRVPPPGVRLRHWETQSR